MTKASYQVRTKQHNNSNDSSSSQLGDHRTLWHICQHPHLSLITDWPTWPDDNVTFGRLDRLDWDWGVTRKLFSIHLENDKRWSKGAPGRRFPTARKPISGPRKSIWLRWWLMSFCWNAKGSFRTLTATHTHTQTNRAPTKDSCVKLTEKRARTAWDVNLWLYI